MTGIILLTGDEKGFMLFFLSNLTTAERSPVAARVSPDNLPVNVLIVIISPHAIIRPAIESERAD